MKRPIMEGPLLELVASVFAFSRDTLANWRESVPFHKRNWEISRERNGNGPNYSKKKTCLRYEGVLVIIKAISSVLSARLAP